MKIFYWAAAFLSLPCLAMANPVSFKDGWGVMPTYTTKWSDLQVNYSTTKKESLGLSAFYRDGQKHKASFIFGQYNYLLRRWNEPDSQANLYLSGGLGARHENSGDDNVAGYAAFEADYETRRIYTLVSGESMQSPSSIGFNRLRYRAGVSVYKAPIDELQTWIIGQIDYMPEMKDQTVVTPLVRFFYNNFALELGSSTRGDIFVAAMAHF